MHECIDLSIQAAGAFPLFCSLRLMLTYRLF
jgi:hypothetical protein